MGEGRGRIEVRKDMKQSRKYEETIQNIHIAVSAKNVDIRVHERKKRKKSRKKSTKKTIKSVLKSIE
jgi:hypothetical protein